MTDWSHINIIRYYCVDKDPSDTLYTKLLAAYVQACRDYQPDRGMALRSFISMRLRAVRSDYYRSVAVIRTVEAQNHEQAIPSLAYRNVMLQEWIAALSSEGREVLHILFNCPEEFFEMDRTSVVMRIRQVLTKRGWNRYKTNKALLEIRQGVKELEADRG